METNNPETLMPNLPSEIINDVLLKLPAKSISRFRCVSKHWCNLLSNDDFIQSHHLKHKIETENLFCFSIERIDNNAHEFRMHITKSSSLYSVFEKRYCGHVKMGSLFQDTNQEIKIVGFHNGLILMRSHKRDQMVRHWLCNPCNKEFKEILIPKAYGPALYPSWASSVTYGVDYNRDTGDYKIVVASCYAYEGNVCYGCRIQVYTLESNSWRTLPNLLPYMCSKRDVVFLRGAFHWTGRRLGSEVLRILSFDIHGSKNFKELAVTQQVDDLINHYTNYTHMALGVLGGCLCIVRAYGCSNIDVWVKKDYNVTESWTKLFNVRIPRFARSMHKVKILWEFKNGEVLFVTTRKTFGTKDCCLVLYDPLSKKCKVTKILHSTEVIEWNIEAYV